jgi:transcriptional regulator with XRE-family HTH domain
VTRSPRRTSTEAAADPALAQRIREEIARRRLSRQAVADAARISLSTLDKALAGRRPFTLTTLVRLEASLGIALRPAAPAPAEPVAVTAPDELGGYARATVRWLEGAYLTLRPSFSDPKSIYAHRTDISWDLAAGHLTFREAERLDRDYTQFGAVAVPHQSGHIYLSTNRHGQQRLAILSRPTITGDLHGLLTTLRAGRGSHLAPVALPLVLRPLLADATAPAYGSIPPHHPAHAGYARLLRSTTADGFATWHGPT